MIDLGDIPMFRPGCRDSVRPAPLLALYDLNAKLAPLDQFGLKGLSWALADGLRALAAASRLAFCRAET